MRYKILGETRAQNDEATDITVGGTRLRALLTALALRPGRTVLVDTLIDEVWAGEPPHDATGALQALVGRLRRTLGKDAVTSETGGYRLVAEPEDVDLFRFERLAREGVAALDHRDPATAARILREALALWRGRALADLPDRAAAARPEAQHLSATRACAEADLLLGRAPELIPELTELTTVHPYDEPLRVLLIRALCAMGRGADALAAYEDARRVLAEGLGTDPGPELRALHAELLNAGGAEGPPATAHAPAVDGRAGRTGNLRPRLTSFVGREPELDAIRADLRRARLVTLTGPGGSGKTRLAEEAAAGHPGAWLAELAPLDQPEAVPGAVVNALGLRETVLMTSDLTAPQDDPVALLVEHCAPRGLLLILDNCEHVIDAAAELAETLLTRCPGLTILATSREPLGVPGESVRPVEPLEPHPAGRLFTERANAVRPGFGADADAAAVEEICRRLDGLPLAIELAAARLRLLTTRQIADRLDDRFRLLTSGSRTVLPRQQTLRAVVDWSWELLDEQERTVLREVSVFAGGWDLAAAEAVCTGVAADVIGALVDKSLVVATPDEVTGGGMRYRLLETIHEYAAERAADRPELLAAAERRHSAYVRALVEQADPRLRSAGQLPWIQRLEAELDNIRAVLHRSVSTGDEEGACALALGMGWFWWLRNYHREGLEWAERVLHMRTRDRLHDTDQPVRSVPAAHIDALDRTDSFYAAPGDTEEHPLYWPRMNLRMIHMFLVAESRPMDTLTDDRMHDYIARVRAAFQEGGPQAAHFPGLMWPFTVLVLEGPDSLRSALDMAVANCRRYGGDWETGAVLMFRTHLLIDMPGRMAGIDEDLAELRVLSRRVGDRWMRAQVCSAAAETAMARSRFTEAKSEYEEALRLAYEVGAYAETPFLIARLAEIAYRTGDRAVAMESLDEASEAADRFAVTDSRAFVHLLRALIALDDGDPERARALYDDAREECARGTPPPQFAAVLNVADARITAAEHGPREGLPVLAAALHEALLSRCSEAVTAGLVDGGAALVSALGDHSRAARLSAAALAWRGGYARPMPDLAVAEDVAARAVAALGRERFEAEYAAGSALDADAVLTELAAATGGEAPRALEESRRVWPPSGA